MREYSVLMSVYDKESPDWLRQSMESMFGQTVPPADFVLVCDGPLTEEVDAVISSMKYVHRDILRIVRLPANHGLGYALMAGLSYCRCELVARMDSDDISRPDRCQRQLRIFEKYPDTDIVSGTIEEFREFRGEDTEITGLRTLPEKPGEILRYARLRCPFNHPCVMYRKKAVLAAGSYTDEDYPEDYYLWVRMLMQGSRGRNIRQPLLWMRAGEEMYQRRAGKDYLRKHLHLFRYMYETGFLTLPQYLYVSAVRSASAYLPNSLRQKVYSGFLHRK